jgi:hypothetical protein
MMSRSWLVILCLVVGSLCTSARAQPDDPTRAASARALFEEGVSLSDKGQWDDAADRFRRALTLRDSQVIRFNLATALIETGKLVEASELLRQVERDGGADRKLRDDARAHLAAAQARIGKLTVTVTGMHEGVRVLLDERPIDPVLMGVAMPADPGLHRVRALRGEVELASSEVTLANADDQIVALELPDPVATPAEAARSLVPAEPLPQRDQGERPSRKLLWWGIGGGVAVAAAIVATVFVMRRSANQDETEAPYEGDFDPPSITVQVGE